MVMPDGLVRNQRRAQVTGGRARVICCSTGTTGPNRRTHILVCYVFLAVAEPWLGCEVVVLLPFATAAGR